MRLWHYELLDCLDDFHIVLQWSELLAIKEKIDKCGTPNHRLVNKVINYSINEFKAYCGLVISEMQKRHIRYSKKKQKEIADWQSNVFDNNNTNINGFLWHNKRYLRECYYNLEEKFDCEIVSESAWQKVDEKYQKLIKR